MTSPSHTDLREELAALAETQPFSPDPAAWDRGRRARRSSRVARGAAALASVALIGGVGAYAVRPDQPPQPAEVPGGALPSRVDLRNVDTTVDSPSDPSPFEEDFSIGRASVAIGGAALTLVGAEDGAYHPFTVPGQVFALSPDGYRLAWWANDGVRDVAGVDRLNPDRIYLADLRTGEVTEWAHNLGNGATVTSLSWWPDSDLLLWQGRDDEDEVRSALIDVPGASETSDFAGRYGDRGIPSPSRDIIALPSTGEVAAAPFRKLAPRESRRLRGIPVDRPLPTDLYPDGAVVTPVGWVDEDHVVAVIDPPPSDVVERPRLAVFTSPDVPESEWTYREFLPRLPSEPISFAVDLVPDLTGDPDQELTHDFSATPAASEDGSSRVPLIAGAVLALLAGLAFIRMMQKRA